MEKLHAKRSCSLFNVIRNQGTVKLTSNHQFSKHFLEQLNNLRCQNLLCDVQIKVGAETFHGHKSVLAIHSDYFYAMFTSNMVESDSSVVCLQEIHSVEALKMLLDYMYSGTLHVNLDNVQDIYVISDMLQMTDIRDECANMMIEYLKINNCLSLLQFAEQVASTTLLDHAYKMVLQYFTEIYTNVDFTNLSVNMLSKILQNDELNLGTKTENIVLESLMLWITSDARRSVHIQDLIKHVRLCHVDSTYLDEVCRSQLFDAEQLSYITRTRENTNIPSRSYQQRLYAVGGYLQARTGPTCPRLQCAEYYSLTSQKWSPVTDLPMPASCVKLFVVQSQIICFAELLLNATLCRQSAKRVRTMYLYDKLQDAWIDRACCVSDDVFQIIFSCLSNDGSICQCATEKLLYTVDFNTVHQIQISVSEDFEVIINKHEKLQSIELYKTEKYRDHCAIVCNGILYSIGGQAFQSQSESHASKVVYKYDKDWVSMASMLSNRACLSCVSHDNKIYALGGSDEFRLKTAEVYDTGMDQWTAIADMNHHRTYFCALSNDKGIYVLGGKSYAHQRGASRKVLCSCEFYDYSSQSWTILEHMDKARCKFAAALI